MDDRLGPADDLDDYLLGAPGLSLPSPAGFNVTMRRSLLATASTWYDLPIAGVNDS